MQRRWIKRETTAAQAEHVDMTDFAVRVKKLPHIYSLDEVDEFKQALTLHLMKVV